MKSLISIRLVVLITLFVSSNLASFAQEVKENSSSSKFEIKEVASIKALVIRTKVPSKEIGPKMGELYGKLFGYLGQMQIQPVGAPFAVYYEYDPNGNTTFEVAVPVASTHKAEGEISFKKFPAMKVLSTIYVGAYEKIGATYEALDKYMKEKSLQSTMICWEVYLTDPSKVKNASENQTIIYFPLK